MGAEWAAALLLAAVLALVNADGVQRSSSNHRLRHSRGTQTRPHRSADLTPLTPEVTAAVGEAVTLDCGDRAAPAGRWYHDGSPVEASARLEPASGGRLLVSEVRLEDTGLWHCRDPGRSRARTAAGLGTPGPRPVLLTVFVPPGEPYLLVGESRPAVGLPLPVRENVPVTLTCVSERSLPPAELSWLVGSAEKNVTAQSRRTVTPLRAAAGTQLFTTRSHVTLNMTRDLAGQKVTCVTSHRHWRVRQRTSLQLDVQYPPNFTVIRTPAFGNPILRGMRVNLTCLAESNPPVPPRWVKDNSPPRVPVKNGTILFNPITMEDAGWYQCTANHLGNNVTSYSFYLNVRDELSGVENTGFRTVQTTVGAPVSLKCSDPGSQDRTRESPCWVREDTAGGQAAVTSRGHRMHLDGALYGDTGIYTCQMPPISEVETKQRARARSFFVKVTGRPMVTNITVLGEAVLGQPASLVASFCSDPPPTSLLWAVGQLAVRPGHRSDLATADNYTDGAQNSCFEWRLQIAALRPELAGPVTVLVVNALGADQLTRPLDVSRPSHVTFSGVAALAVPQVTWVALVWVGVAVRLS
ncbi:kin of IRRE-like protein 3 [Amphibalanus amphitrite]|uniref:kin of IRRE-like protein 3 n=1 Tax=Amphibalanus amphitrite TaxID=1232801 RepID=UPI001C90AA01|nr:kin of IRRE-like protein 3 [Amphibalanus amphitrite]